MSGWPCRFGLVLVCAAVSASAAAQPSIRLKTRTFVPPANVAGSKMDRPRGLDRAAGVRRHLLVQFEAAVTAGDLERLRAAGAVPLRYVPDNAFAVSAEPGFEPGTVPGLRWTGDLEASDKLSEDSAADLARPRPAFARTIIEFHPDLDRAATAVRLAAAGARTFPSPRLPRYMAVVATERAVIARLAADDAVAWIFPASNQLADGGVLACEGTLTGEGIVADFATVGEGWDGPGRYSASLSYFISTPSRDLGAATAQAEVERAFAEWGRYVEVTWRRGSSAGEYTSSTVLWGDSEHGDGYPFAPETLAHTFYPSPPTPETFAGDIHFNEDYLWGAGDPTRYDVFSVALHEAGHALGLAHSGNPDSVMYPIYRGIVSGLSDTDINGARSLYATSATAIPEDWTAASIGAPMGGSVSGRDGAFTVEASGRDIWDTADEFRFVSTPLRGDGDIVARVDALVSVHRWTKAGVMIRADATPGSPHAFMLVSGGKGLAFQRRRTRDALSVSTEPVAGAAPRWLWLSRRGTRVDAYAAVDGGRWQLIGSDTIALGEQVLAGLAVTSHDPAAVATAQFSGVAVTPAVGWNRTDIGAVGVPGRWTATPLGGRVSGAGDDIWDQADAFTFVWLTLYGDGEIVARVASVQYTRAWSKAGVMIRDNATPGSPHAFMLVSAGKGYAFQRRVQQGDISYHTSGGAGIAPQWVKLVRRGNTITAYRSADGKNWILVGSDSVTMGTSPMIGLAVSSHTATASCEAVFEYVSVRQY